MSQNFKSGRLPSKYDVARGGLCASVLALACGSQESGATEPNASQASESVPVQPAQRDEPRSEAGVEADPVATGASAAPESPPATDPGGAEPQPAAAPEPAARCDGSLSFDDLYAAIDADLRREGDDAPFLRYVSLSHRYNQGFCPEDLEGDRLALVKALNSLSTEFERLILDFLTSA